MDLNQVLFIIVGIGAIGTLWRSTMLFPGKYNRGWVGLALIVLVGMLILWFILPAYVGLIAGFVWFVFVILPHQLARLAYRWFPDNSIGLMQLAAWLHPMDAFPADVDMLRVMKLEYQGDIQGALAILERYRDHPLRNIYANAKYFRINAQYGDLLRWLEANVTMREYQRDPLLISLYLQALGQVGKLNEMLAAFAEYKSSAERLPRHLPELYLNIFTDCGRVSQVEQLVKTVYPRRWMTDTKRLTVAYAQIAAGHDSAETGRQTLQDLLNSTDGGIRNAASHLSTHPIAIADEVLTPESKQLLAQFEREFDLNYQFTGISVSRSWLTWGLIIINVAVFCLEVQQGLDSDRMVLYYLGGLFAPAVLQLGEWWRLGAHMFLHLDVVHLTLNMLALWLFGRFVEQQLSRISYILVYLGSGLGAGFVFLGLAQLQPDYRGIGVGASAAIMGLVGASVAIYGNHWRKHKSGLAQRGLRFAVLIVLLQVGVDLLILQNSLTGHLSGAVIGFLIAILILWVTQRKQTAVKKVVA